MTIKKTQSTLFIVLALLLFLASCKFQPGAGKAIDTSPAACAQYSLDLETARAFTAQQLNICRSTHDNAACITAHNANAQVDELKTKFKEVCGGQTPRPELAPPVQQPTPAAQPAPSLDYEQAQTSPQPVLTPDSEPVQTPLVTQPTSSDSSTPDVTEIETITDSQVSQTPGCLDLLSKSNDKRTGCNALNKLCNRANKNKGPCQRFDSCLRQLNVLLGGMRKTCMRPAPAPLPPLKREEPVPAPLPFEREQPVPQPAPQPVPPPCSDKVSQQCNRNQCGGAGIVKCDGSCSAKEPALPSNYDKACGCEDKGKVQCDGGCSASLSPPTYGQDCKRNQCGGSGVIKCDGSCSASAPNTDYVGRPCNRVCGGDGVTKCDGSCSAAIAPATYGEKCNRNLCGGTGTIDCAGQCTAEEPFVPSVLGVPCACNGNIQCDFSCKPNCPAGQTCQAGQCVGPAPAPIPQAPPAPPSISCANANTVCIGPTGPSCINYLYGVAYINGKSQNYCAKSGSAPGTLSCGRLPRSIGGGVCVYGFPNYASCICPILSDDISSGRLELETCALVLGRQPKNIDECRGGRTM